MRWILPLLLCGCLPVDAPVDDDDDDDATAVDDDDFTEPEGPAVWGDAYALLRFRCGCHVDDTEGGLGGFDDPDLAYANLVNVPSTESPLDRVEPGDVEASYLIWKIRGEPFAVGGEGDRMPPTGLAMRDWEIGLLAEWIELGALP